MGDIIEMPVQRLVDRGLEATVEHVRTRGALLFFVWMSLIFVKTHLRDRIFRFHLDHRKGSEAIADLYDWSTLHHVHCVARSFYTQATITPEAFGSFFCLAARTHDLYEHFDYGDLYSARAILLRLGDICLIFVLNDSNAALSAYMRDFEKINGALSPLQLRELFAHLAYINVKLKVRPTFATEVDSGARKCRIVAFRPPTIELEPYSRRDFGEILYACARQTVEKLRQPNARTMVKHIRKGTWSFLFDRDGKFIQNSVMPAPEKAAESVKAKRAHRKAARRGTSKQSKQERATTRSTHSRGKPSSRQR